jgi:hypothetical protein
MVPFQQGPGGGLAMQPHRPVPGNRQQAGRSAGQFAFEAHSPHRPDVQKGWLGGHWPSQLHSQQPKFDRQQRPPEHSGKIDGHADASPSQP